MIFSSATFLIFFVAVLLIYLAARTIQQRATLLLIASIIFYASWKPSYLVLLGASLGINYVILTALLARRSRVLLVGGVVLNLLTLAACKYLRFAVESSLSISHYFGLSPEAHAPTWMNWALPLGISFYTFHMLSAIIDVYRGVWAKPVSFSRWCLYVTFFPHLIAGPILRPGQLIDQLGDLKPIQATEFRLGAAIFCAGLVKKVLFADNLAPIVDKLYAFPGALDFSTAWLGTIAFAFQIYFDFAGYSEMAIGLARIFGVVLPRNFIYPYISRSPSEFWRRWHVTLSQWLRDYLFIPLGGSRGTTGQTSANLMTTMLLGGLWHGANWTFVVWGGLHGLYLLGARLIDQGLTRLGIDKKSPVWPYMSILGAPITFALVCVAWVFFRATDFTQAWSICRSMLGFGLSQSNGPTVRSYELVIIGVSGLLILVEPLLVKVIATRGIDQWWRVPFPVRGIAYAMLVLVLVVLGGQTAKFIYFDF